MKNRRYFTCPIQALYMMKEFGVEFRTKHRNFDVIFFRDFSKMWVDQINVDNDSGAVRLVDVINCMDESKNRVNDRIYVIEESEAIFEQKKGDIGIQQDHGYLAIAKAQEFEDFEENNGTVSPSRYWKIIMRDNKHFFMGELENETQH